MELFYAQPNAITDTLITLDKFESAHLLKTLRKKKGDVVEVTDGIGSHFSAVIAETKPRLLLEITGRKIHQKAATNLALAIGFIRPNRLEFVLEKGTELGVNRFFIIRTEFSNYFSNNKEKFDKLIRQAIKQSNRFFLPEIVLCKNFNDFLAESSNSVQKIAAIDGQSPPLSSLKISTTDLLFCVGPEGGFSAEEIEAFKAQAFQTVSLGLHRLRAETAAIAGLSLLAL